MAWIEQTERRGQKVKYYRDDANPGKFRAVFSIHDQHYHDGSAWQDVDETLVDDGVGGFDKKCEKTRHIFRVTSGGNQRWYPRRNIATEYVEITAIEYWRTTGGGSWRAINLPAAVWKSNGADWDLSNLHVELINTWRRIKTSFILKDNTAPTRLRFALSFTGLTFDSTTWEVKSGTDVVGTIPPPSFTDANDADVPVTTTWASGYIEWSVNPTGFTYPLTSHSVTFTDGYGGDVTTYKDTSVLGDQAELGFGAVNKFYIRNNRKGLVEFDLSSIDSAATCDSATLSLYAEQTLATATVTLYSIASGNAAWVEGSNNWNTASAGTSCWEALAADGAGGVTTAWAGSAGLSTSGTDYEASSIGSISVNGELIGTEKTAALTTSRVEDWFGASNTNYGILITTTSDSYAITFCSSDHATTGYRPKLVVLYTAGGASGTLAVTLGSATASATGTVQVSGTANVTLGAATCEAVGTVTVYGTAAATLADATLTATGTVANITSTGTLDATLDAATLSATGTNQITGTASVTLSAATCAATGTVAVAGTASITLADATGAGTGTVTVYGAAGVTLADATLSATGTVTTVGEATGTLDVTLGAATVSASGSVFSLDYLRPTADTTVGNWTTNLGASTGLYDTINEATPNDEDYAMSEVSPTSSPVVFTLSVGGDAGKSIGHTLRYRYGKAITGAGETVNLTVQLRQGYTNESSQGTLIAEWTHSNITEALVTAEQVLTAEQADSITNYGSLFARLVAEAV